MGDGGSDRPPRPTDRGTARRFSPRDVWLEHHHVDAQARGEWVEGDEDAPLEMQTGDELAAELERFLRDQEG